MTLEELVEAHLAGQAPTVPVELREPFERAVAGHKALERALGETIVVPDRQPEQRGAPLLPEDYEVVREIGHGGMGVVFLARQRSLGRLVAVKVLRPGEIAFGPIVRRFVEEARHLARLRHPNIVSIHESGQAGDEPYFTMDFIEGESLAALLKHGPLSPTQALRILTQAAAGVEHAHAQGIIHRDLKPANILVDRAGHAFVTDFGLARDVSRASELTGTGDVLGTPAYMAPEQANGDARRIGEATDVHALGVVLYEMLTGRAPYGHGAPAEVLVRLLRDEPAPPRSIDRRIPRDLETICMKAMAKEPERRYATVRAFLEDLRRFEAGEAILARRTGLVRRLARFVWRHRMTAALTFVLVAAFGASLLVIQNRARVGANTQAKLDFASDQLNHGDPAQAVRIYHELIPKTDEGSRWLLLHLMASGCAKVRDRQESLDCWRRLLSLAPDASFRGNDWLIASALVDDLRVRHSFLQEAASADRAGSELAVKRLRVVLGGKDATEEQRQQAREHLALLEAGLHPAAGTERTETDPLGLPGGPLDVLEAHANDVEVGPRLRAECMLAAARMREAHGDRETALARYQAAFELLRDTSPIYSCPNASVTHRVSTISQLDGTEKPNDLGYEMTWHEEEVCCRQLKEAHASLERLSGPSLTPFRGGLVFHAEGLDRIQGLQASLEVDVWSRSIEDAEGHRNGISHSHQIGLRPGHPARLGVVDGTYRINVSLGSVARAASSYAVDPEFVAIDCDDLPKEVTVSGGWLDLPSVHVRILSPMAVEAPLAGASVDLRTQVFSWTAVPGATRYRLFLAICEESEEEVLRCSTFHSIESPLPRACFGTAPREDVRGLQHSSVGGRPGYWYVEAYDPVGHVIARYPQHENILFSHGLDDE